MRQNKIYKAFTKEQFNLFYKQITFIIMQQIMDCINLTLNQVYGFDSKKVEQLRDPFYENWCEFCDIANSDVKTDEQMWYTRDKMDKALINAFGEENVEPWEKRYHQSR